MAFYTIGYKVVIGTAYRPQWVDVDTFFDVITESLMQFSNFDYVVLLTAFWLTQRMMDPTYFSVDSSSLIDVICTNCRVENVVVSNIRSDLGHAMITGTLVLKKTKPSFMFLTYKPIKNICLTDFDLAVAAIDWLQLSIPGNGIVPATQQTYFELNRFWCIFKILRSIGSNAIGDASVGIWYDGRSR